MVQKINQGSSTASKLPKIIFVIGNYKNGGVARHSTVIANELARHGYSVILLATTGIGKDVFFHREENVELVSLAEFVETHTCDKTLARCKKRICTQIKILKHLRKYVSTNSWVDNALAGQVRKLRHSTNLQLFLQTQPRAVLIPFGMEYYYMALAGKRRCDKLIYAERNASQLEVPPDQLPKAGAALSKADAIVFQTHDEMDYYQDFALQNVSVIRNPISGSLPQPYVGERRKAIVNFCRISGQKNLPMMVDAFAMLHRQYPDYHMEIYGNTVAESEETLKNELIAYVRKLGLEEHIHILPPRADVHEICRDAAMFVSTSYFEGLSNSMLEAMAIGLPCICTDCLGGGAREIIRDGENGLLVPNEDVQACYAAMCRMIEDRELACRCSKNAAKLAQELSAEQIGNSWKQVIRKIS